MNTSCMLKTWAAYTFHLYIEVEYNSSDFYKCEVQLIFGRMK